MLTDNVSTLLWMLIFFVVFYLYIDIRITKLRKELLSHYMVCENMLSNGLKKTNLVHGTTTQDHPPLKLISSMPSFSNDVIDSFTDTVANIIPTREETAHGLTSLNNLKCTGTGCDGMQWLADSSPVGSGFNPEGLSGYNVSDEGSYAIFEMTA